MYSGFGLMLRQASGKFRGIASKFYNKQFDLEYDSKMITRPESRGTLKTLELIALR